MSATSSTESAREERDAEDVVVALEEDGSKDSDAEDVAEVDAEVVAAGDEVLDADVEVTVGDAGAAGAGVSGG
ncbi:hypothetical protein ACUY2U_08390, partial [Corynebacterium phoceense]